MTDTTNATLWALSTADPDVCGECAGVTAPAPEEPRPAEDHADPVPPLPEPL